MYDIIFILNGVEKIRYTYEDEFTGERQATRELIAYENNVNINDVKIYKQKRNKFNITLWCYNSIYGEYEDLDYNNAFNIICECLELRNGATIKTNDNKIYSIQNNENLRYFVEEFGACEI